MEDNKYSNLILKLIREHRKYSQVQNMESSIVDDVYQRAKAILSSIEDQEAIEPYLKKVVSISIITASKNVSPVKITSNVVISTLNESYSENITDTQSFLSNLAENNEVDSFSAVENKDATEVVAEENLIPEPEVIIDEDIFETHEPDKHDIYTNENSDDLLNNDENSTEMVTSTDVDPSLKIEDVDFINLDIQTNAEEVINEISKENIDEEIIAEETLPDDDEVTNIFDQHEELQLEDVASENFETTNLSDKMINSLDGSDYEGIAEPQNSSADVLVGNISETENTDLTYNVDFDNVLEYDEVMSIEQQDSLETEDLIA